MARNIFTLQGWKDLLEEPVKIEVKTAAPAEATEKTDEPKAFFRPPGSGGYRNFLFSFSQFDGETGLGGIGPVKEYIIEHEALRARGWEAYLTNETVQTVINKSVIWSIGKGLRLQSIPNVKVLESEGVEITKESAQDLSDLIEARFSVYKESMKSSLSGMRNLSQDEATCYINASNGGDVLVILNYKDDLVKYQLIDGAHVKSPMGGTDWNPQLLGNGNRIMNGVEMNGEGGHEAYWVQNADLKFDRIPVRSKKTGLKIAALVGGMEFRLDTTRCMPVFSGLFEVLKGMERYADTTLSTAEEQNNVVYQIEHEPNSTGESHLQQQISRARDQTKNDGTVPVDVQLTEMANKAAVSTKRQVVNNVVGAKLTPLDKNKGELYFKDFYSVFFDMVCAAKNMPPNVAMSKYDTSFSSARAAIKDWEHGLMIDRYKFALQFQQVIYEFWLHTEVLKNKINLPQYLTAHRQGNEMILQSYRTTNWIGDNVPHIDPLKEVMAERLKIGETGASIPLTTVEAATEALNGGDSKSNMQQYSKELAQSKELKIEVPLPPAPVVGGAPGKKKDASALYRELWQHAFNISVQEEN